jgi:hypothetical protein
MSDTYLGVAVGGTTESDVTQDTSTTSAAIELRTTDGTGMTNPRNTLCERVKKGKKHE